MVRRFGSGRRCFGDFVDWSLIGKVLCPSAILGREGFWLWLLLLPEGSRNRGSVEEMRIVWSDTKGADVVDLQKVTTF